MMGTEPKWEVIGTDVNRPLVYKDYGNRFCIKSYMDNPDTVGVYENERSPLAEALCKGTGHEVIESAKLRELEAKVAELTKPKQTARVHVPVEPEVPTTPLPQKDKE